MSVVGLLHERHVHARRVRVLRDHLASLLPPDASVLDVGCGDGLLDAGIAAARPDVRITGIDVLVRPAARIPVAHFDGRTIPLGDAGVDVVMLVDVLHHTDDPMVLLREARRVARRAVVIKDHTMDGPLAGPTLRLMDRVGNAHHGVVLPYNYWPKARWLAAFAELGLAPTAWRDRLGLYAPPASLLFERRLHFVTRLEPPR